MKENVQFEIPHEPLQTILANMKLEELNMYEICVKVYEATYMRYSMKFYEEKTMREKVESKIIGKNETIDKLVKVLTTEYACLDDFEEDKKKVLEELQ